jgi:hypothetical protein
MDKREEILQRMYNLFTTLSTDPLIPLENRLETVVRNRGVLDQDKRPAGIMLDGDERTLTGKPRGRLEIGVSIVEMSPQFFIVLKSSPPKNEGKGTQLNYYRDFLIRKFAHDQELLNLVGANGGITYAGMSTDMKTGMTLEGQAQLDFKVKCVVNPYA